MSLADQIVERNMTTSPNQEVDEFGIPVPHPETPEYLVARALALDERHLEETEPRIHGLHLRGSTLFRGHTPLEENRRTVLKLAQLKRSLRDWEEVEFWRILRQCVPVLNRRILQIATDLYWDTDKAELINREEAYERANKA